MATKVEESYSERDQKVDAKGNVTEVEIPYIVTGVSDEDAALVAERLLIEQARRLLLLIMD